MDDITKAVEEWKPPRDLVLELSREPLEMDEICQLQRCVPRLKNIPLIECFTLRCLDLEL